MPSVMHAAAALALRHVAPLQPCRETVGRDRWMQHRGGRAARDCARLNPNRHDASLVAAGARARGHLGSGGPWRHCHSTSSIATAHQALICIHSYIIRYQVKIISEMHWLVFSA